MKLEKKIISAVDLLHRLITQLWYKSMMYLCGGISIVTFIIFMCNLSLWSLYVIFIIPEGRDYTPKLIWFHRADSFWRDSITRKQCLSRVSSHIPSRFYEQIALFNQDEVDRERKVFSFWSCTYYGHFQYF